MPDPVLQKLAKAFAGVIEHPDFQQKLKAQALDTHSLYLKAFDDFIAQEINVWGPVMKATGVRFDD